MPIDLEDRGQALENEYFHRKEQELLDKMKQKLADDASQPTEMTCPRCDGKLVSEARNCSKSAGARNEVP